MTNFKILFEHPWLLLLLVPAFAITFFYYFRISKRYRRTRNRIISMILHFVVITLSVVTLAGIHFTYEIPNMETQVILLVDISDTGKDVEQAKNDFIYSAIQESEDVCQIGVVTFGFGEPTYAVPLTTEVDNVYEQYLYSVMEETVDTTATDISSALLYTKDLFANKEVAKIVVISDGMQTDGSAASAIKTVAAEGIQVSTAYFSADKPVQEVQLIGVTTPDYNVNVGDNFLLQLSVQSSYVGKAELTLYDNGVAVSTNLVDFIAGVQELEVEHSYAVPGLHTLGFEIAAESDTWVENNTYQTYMYLETFTKVLMVERNVGESTNMKNLLDEQSDGLLDITVVSTFDSELPDTLDEMRAFDQVILVNIANADMPQGFDELLYRYVYEIGGGLLTIGGNQVDNDGNVVLDAKGDVVANAYNREDMRTEAGGDTLYQQMLPVQAIDYTPPIGVMIIIDRSGSMDGSYSAGGQSKLDLAKEGAKACLRALSSRDYVGIMTLDDTYSEEIPLTPRTQEAKILAAIDGIQIGGNTVFTSSLERAGAALKALTNVERRHVILVSDGLPGDKYDDYGPKIKHYNETAGVTYSMVIIDGQTTSEEASLRKATEVDGGGRYYNIWDVGTLPTIMREELNMPEIKAVHHEPFVPEIANYTSIVSGVNQADIPQLSGFYGTKLKDGATASLMGEYVPIYAQWKYGEGMVGSFMCDLNKVWSKDFMEDATGKRIVSNIVNAIFPTTNIRAKEIDVDLKEENYITQMSVYTDLKEGDTIELNITSPTGKGNETVTTTVLPEADSVNSRIKFVIKQPGTHLLTVVKKDADGNVIAQYSTYKTFSYSQEYNMFLDLSEGATLMETMAISGKGSVLTEAETIFEEIAETLHREYDPRLPFILAALILFLMDIAVRKFKFKWPHEIIRDRRAKKLLQVKTN